MKKILLLIIFLFLASAFLNAQGGSTLRAKCPNSTRYFSLILQADGNINATPCEGKNFQINGENVIVNPTPTPTPTPTTSANYYLSCKQVNGHVNAGAMYALGKRYYQFLWFAVVRPEQPNWVYYWLSTGYGGAHTALAGFDTGLTKFGVTGNVLINGTTLTSVGTAQKFPLNTWHFVALAFDGQKLVYIVDGVPEAYTQTTGEYRQVNGIGDSVAFLCGSDHNQGDLSLAYAGAFEGNIPVNIGLLAPFRPPTYPTSTWLKGNAYYNTSILLDFTKPANIIADLSEGLSNGNEQIETQTITLSGAVTAGQIKSVFTANGLPNSPVTITADIANNATESDVATALRNAYRANSTIDGFYYTTGTGANLNVISRLPQSDDSTNNFTVENVTSGGVTDDLTSTNTQKGYAGKFVRHSAILEGQNPATGAYNDPNLLNPTTTPPSNVKPTFVQGDFVKPSPVTKPTPTGLPLVIDKFDNRISVPFWDNIVRLGSTTGGSEGVKVWQNGDSYGVTSSGEVFYDGEGFGVPVYVNLTATDFNAEYLHTSDFTGIVRYTDNCNNVQIQTSGTSLTITKTIACVSTGIFNNSVIGVAPEQINIRVIENGANDNIKVFFAGAEQASVTTDLPTGAGVGFLEKSYTLDRVSSFVIYNP